MTCPNSELLAAMAEGRLGRPERDALLDHVAECDDCRQTLLILGAPSRARSSLRTWIPWAAAAAVAVSIMTLLVYGGRGEPPGEERPAARAPVKPPVQPAPEHREPVSPPEPRKPEERPKPEEPATKPAPVPPERTPAPEPPVKPAPEKPAPPTDPAPTPPPPAPEPPKPTTVAVMALLDRVEGDVQVVIGQERIPAKAGRELRNGEGLEVKGPRSGALVSFPDRTRLELAGDTLIREMFDREATKGRRVFVDKGAVKADVAKQPAGQAMVFETPHGTATVLGTTLRVLVDPDPKKGLRLEVEEGKVRLSSREGKTTDVLSGYFAVAASGLSIAPRRLPKEEILISLDFEEGKRPALAARGIVERGPDRPGSRFCLSGDTDASGSSKVMIGDEAAGLLTFTGDEVLSFDYWVDPQAGSVNLHVWNRTQGKTQDAEVPKLVSGKWTRVTMRLADLGEPGNRLKEGDWAASLYIQGTGPAPRKFYVDNLLITRPFTLKPRVSEAKK